MREPFMPEVSKLIPPADAEAALRASLPPWQKNYTSDDYVEYTWHAPTVRLYVGRAMLRPPKPGYRYPDWPRNALGGYPDAIDPLWDTAARAVGATLIDLFTDPAGLKRCRDEFVERTGGGIGGKKWLKPLLPRNFKAPVDFRWPEYVTTVRGEEWWIPTERE
jgi:aminobenzoyl-glutamate utilization protein B